VKSPLPHKPDGSDKDYCYVQDGRDISEIEASDLEARLAKNPNDLPARLKLIGYYERVGRDKEIFSAGLEHILWMIDHRPADYVCYTLSLGENHSDEQYAEFERHWIEQVKRHPNDDKVVGNAGSSINHKNRALSWQYFKRAKCLNTLEPRWTRRLARRARYEALNGDFAQRATYAQIAIEEAKNYFKLDDTRGEQIGLCMDVTPVAIEFGYMEQARQWSEWLLEGGRNSTFRLWAQTAYLFLARIETIEGNIKAAKVMLNRALNSLKNDERSHVASGHQMIAVLDKLLEIGEKEIVVEALQVSIEKGAEEREEKLQEWLTLIKCGETPKLEWAGRR